LKNGFSAPVHAYSAAYCVLTGCDVTHN